MIPDMPPDDEDASNRQGREEPAEADRITLALSYSPSEARDAHAMLDRMITRGKTSHLIHSLKNIDTPLVGQA
ncbi:hypothetical protein BV511_06485 [Methylorubrum extorquens]|uniref:hypothetical protein n=1 Tax=Methylorubrum extorquens TaxID=408 RepID=UPI000972CAB0|nr:hypothetical protein [Methylorubrum extorquens]APX84396.1 hypothetical protein BV511_06485 [Methylorubrum extorquens]